MNCPNCNSDHTRRGGSRTWMVYVGLIALAVPAVLLLELHAGLVAGIMIAVAALAHLVFGERTCVDCGHQWR
jgi:hypothetical protein